MESILKVKRLSKAFGGLQALSEFDLQVNQGDLCGLIGPNGAGKTTVFNLITGFIRADSGEVWLKGEKINQLKPFEIVNRGMARTFQLVDLFKEMTVLENVMVPCFSHRARIRKHAGKLPRQVALEFLEEVGLGSSADKLVKNLAFGQLRLLDIARAMATEPDILLLDEPFSGLDAEDAAVLSTAIQRMHQRGQTMIIIEHRLKDLLKLVARVVAIVFGQKIAEGTPEDIMSNDKVIRAYLGERRT